MNQRPSAVGLGVARVLTVIFGLVVLAPSSLAQTDTELTESQLDYNNKGVMLINEGKYDEALGYFQSSLAIGEANVTFLNLGRTYTRMGRCAQADAAFRKVETAPKVKSPPPAVIAKILKRYRADLEKECSARLRLRCPAVEVSVSIDDAPPTTCPELPIPIQPGEHRVEISHNGRKSVQTVETQTGEVTQLVVTVPEKKQQVDKKQVEEKQVEEKQVEEKQVEEKQTVEEPVTKSNAPPSNGLRTAAWVSSIGGGALLVTGVVLDQTVVDSRLEDAEAAASAGDRAAYAEQIGDYEGARDLNRAVFIAGGALATSGVVMWILSSDEAGERTGGASVVPRDGGASLEVNWRW